MKSCLKCTQTPPPTPVPPPDQQPSPSADSAQTSAVRPSCEKHVSFCAQGAVKVFVADEWDRTPAIPARKLTYEDILELKHLQSSLPRAEQRPECASYHPSYLKKVPMSLLPLLPEADPVSPSPPAQTTAPPPPVAHPPSPPTTPPPRPVRMSRFTMPFLPLLPPAEPASVPAPAVPAPKSKLNFSFLPLLPPAEPPYVPTVPSSDPTSAPPPQQEHTPETDEDGHLPTPSSTPALTTCSLASDSDSGPPSPGPASPPGEPAVMRSRQPHFLDAFPAPPGMSSAALSRNSSRTASPARDPRRMFTDSPQARDPRRMFDDSPPSRDPRRMFDDASPASTIGASPAHAKSQHSLDAPDAPAVLALRLSTLGLAPPSPPLGSSADPSAPSTPSSLGSLYHHSAGDSPAPDAATLLAQSGYFHMPPSMASRRAGPQPHSHGALPPHVRSAFSESARGGHALPDSPFVDPMMSLRSAPAAAARAPEGGPDKDEPQSPVFLQNVDSDDEEEVCRARPPVRRGPPIHPFALRLPAKGAPRPVKSKAVPPCSFSALKLEALPSPSLNPPSPFFLSSPPAGAAPGAQAPSIAVAVEEGREEGRS